MMIPQSDSLSLKETGLFVHLNYNPQQLKKILQIHTCIFICYIVQNGNDKKKLYKQVEIKNL